MADIAIFRINYKSDFILTLQSDAGWLTPFCIKFWTGAPSQAYYAYYDGMSYTHCAPVDGEPTKLLVQFDDHHLPIGDLKFQIGYHFTVADFPTSVEDEVINQASVIIEIDDAPAQVMLDFNGETAPEIQFALPAYVNEAQRIANEQARIAAEEQRIANEQARISAEETRQANEQQRINAEAERVSDFASLKTESEAATAAANIAATLANEKAQLADDKAALAQAAATLANAKAQLAADKAALAQAAATLANEKAALAQQKAEYAQEQGDAAKTEAETAHALNEEVRDDEEARDQAEQIRQQQETARQQAESQRVTDFNAQMQQQQTAYTDAEAARETAFNEAETERDAKVDEKVADITNLQAQIGYFVCDTAAATAAKTIAATGYVLTTGGNIRIKMTNANTVDNATLNINSTGAKPLFYEGARASSTNTWAADEVLEIYYDGTNYQAKNVSPTFKTGEKVNSVGVDDEPTAGSENVVKSGGVANRYGDYVEIKNYIKIIVDNNNKFLFGIKSDGSIEWAKGVPVPIKEELLKKVDKIEGRDLVKTQYIHELDYYGYVKLILDKEGRILFGIKDDGSVEWYKGIPTPIKEYIDSVPAPIKEYVDSKIKPQEDLKVIDTTVVNGSAIPIIAMVFDDGPTRDSKMVEWCNSRGLKASFALFGDVDPDSDYWKGIKERYSGYIANGHDVICHGGCRGMTIINVKNTPYATGLGQINEIQANETLSYTKASFDAIGFNSKGFTYFNSTSLTPHTFNLVQRYYSYALGSGTAIEGFTNGVNPIGTYPYRFSRQTMDTSEGVQTIYDLIDNNIGKNVLIILGTHMARLGTGGDYSTEEEVLQLLDYIKEKVDNKQLLSLGINEAINTLYKRSESFANIKPKKLLGDTHFVGELCTEDQDVYMCINEGEKAIVKLTITGTPQVGSVNFKFSKDDTTENLKDYNGQEVITVEEGDTVSDVAQKFIIKWCYYEWSPIYKDGIVYFYNDVAKNPPLPVVENNTTGLTFLFEFIRAGQAPVWKKISINN